jgi:hypothetical protein
VAALFSGAPGRGHSFAGARTAAVYEIGLEIGKRPVVVLTGIHRSLEFRST